MTAVRPSPPDPSEHPPQYPFAEWLNGNLWTLTRGRDFWGPPHQFVKKIEASARARRLVLFMRYDPDGRYIELCATPRPSADSDIPLVTREIYRG